jgi:hypothetical protein
LRNKYQTKDRKSNHKFEVAGGQELLVRVTLPIAEVWAEMQAQVEEQIGQAGLQILRASLENDVTHRVGPAHRRKSHRGLCVGWGSSRVMSFLLDRKYRRKLAALDALCGFGYTESFNSSGKTR